MVKSLKTLGNKLLTVVSVKLSTVLRGYALNSPQSVFLELASTCNLHCPGCPVSTARFRSSRSRMRMTPGDVRLINERVGRYCDTFVLNIWGESLLNKDIMEVLDVLRGRRLILSTNLNIPPTRLNSLIEYQAQCGNISELIVSMDGWDRQSYETYYRHGGSYDLITQNLGQLRDSVLSSQVILQFLDNGTIPDFRRCAFKFTRTYGFTAKIAVMDQNFNKQGLYSSRTRECHLPYIGLYIDSALNVMTCCSDPFGTLNVQHLHDCNGFNHIWNSEAMRARRLALTVDKQHFLVCRHCDGSKFRFLSRK